MLVNGLSMKRLVRHYVEINNLFNKIDDSDLQGRVRSDEVEQGYYAMIGGVQKSMDKRLHDFIEEEGGINESMFELVDNFIDTIQGTEFEDVDLD
jgi:hypothetical protein